MAASASLAGSFCTPRTILFLALASVSASLLTSCEREFGENPRQAEALKADVDEGKRRLSHIQNSLAAKDAELAVNTQALENVRNGLAEMEQTLKERDAQLKAAKAEVDDLKKRDGFVFAEIAALQQQGQAGAAVTRYQKFIAEFPKSPLVAHANNAIAKLTEMPKEIRKQVELADPKRKEREFSKVFNEGYMTLQELGPILKKKTVAQVIALLGNPNQAFNGGAEIGYADRVVNPLTGTRGLLVVSFEDGAVASLRVEYAGRKFIP